MHDSDKVTVADRAWIGWSQLPASTRATILGSLGGLAGRPAEQWPAGEVERWWADDDLYALRARVGPDELLVFFRAEGDRIVVDSLMLQETIDQLGKGR
jgi:hypothetical protein